MKRAYKWALAMMLTVAGGTMSSCTTNVLMPTRDAAVDGLADFVSQTVFDVLTSFVSTDGTDG